MKDKLEELYKKQIELCHAIEALPASELATRLSVQASDIAQGIRDLNATVVTLNIPASAPDPQAASIVSNT